jgi:hypothetical protein
LLLLLLLLMVMMLLLLMVGRGHRLRRAVLESTSAAPRQSRSPGAQGGLHLPQVLLLLLLLLLLQV